MGGGVLEETLTSDQGLCLKKGLYDYINLKHHRLYYGRFYLSPGLQFQDIFILAGSVGMLTQTLG